MKLFISKNQIWVTSERVSNAEFYRSPVLDNRIRNRHHVLQAS
jgi:hypothetical protein